jgi:dihydropyrimidinase
MIDTIIRSDRVVTPQGVGAYDIAISGQAIAAVAAIGALPVGPQTRLIDATGKLVIPGGIDPHVHCTWHIPRPDCTT